MYSIQFKRLNFFLLLLLLGALYLNFFYKDSNEYTPSANTKQAASTELAKQVAQKEMALLSK